MSQGKLPRNVRVLGWASLLNDTASEMVFPLLPTFLIEVLGGTRAHLGIIEGVAESTASLLKLWSGVRSDRVGRRSRLVLVGYLLATVARVLMAWCAAPWHLFGLRTADRVGKGIRTAPRDALIADSVEPSARGRAFGFHRAMDHAGAAFGPLLATAFLWFWPGELRALFWWTALPGAAVLAVLFFGLREAARSTPESDGEWTPSSTRVSVDAADDATRRPVVSREFRLYLVALGLFTLGNSSDAFLLVRAGELGVATFALPLLWIVFHLVKSAGNWWAGRFVDRWGARRMILAGWLVYGGTYLLFGVASVAWQAWALFLAYGSFYALTESAEKTLVAELVGSQGKGAAYGWFHLVIGVMALPSSILFGGVYESLGAQAAFGMGAGLAAAGAVVLMVGVRRIPRTIGP